MPNENSKKMQLGAGIAAIVENPRRGEMTDKPARPRLIGGKSLLMAAEPKPVTAGKRRMAPFTKTRSAAPSAKDVPDMRPGKPTPPAETGGASPGYLRLRLRVAGDEISVIGAKAVEGPLVEPTRLTGQLAYEVTLGGKRLATGAIADAGERRSFPNLEGPAEQRGHFISTLPSYEIAVRVPKQRLSTSSLSRLGVTIFHLKDELPGHVAPDVPLAEQFPRELREVARMKGIALEKLEAPLQTQLRRALG